MIQRAGLLAAAMISLPSAASHAQTIRGNVADRLGAPVAGVVVQLVDSLESVVARALSNERGEYRLTAGNDGMYHVRTQRIGFRPESYGPYNLRASADVEHRLVLTGLPVALSTVAIVGQNPCRSLGDSTAATYLLWEQVRTALTAVQLTARGRANAATTVMYERMLDPDARRVVEQTASIHADYVSQPWRSLAADSLRRAGYVVSERDGSLTYHAPGLEVLLADAFLDDHCFLIDQSGDSRRIGIAFEPTPARRRLPEIRGTLWLDRESSELRSMEFRYVNLSQEREAHSGGDMEFARMTNGAWVISRWSIRMPVLELRSTGARVGRFGRARAPEIQVAGIKVSGGELALVRRGRDTLWTRPPLVLAGTVVDSMSGTPVPGVQVAVLGTSLTAVGDVAGRFALADMLPGVYTLQVRSASLDSVGAVHQSRLQFTGAAAPVQIRIPTAGQIAATLCGDAEAMDADSAVSRGIVAGTVKMRADSAPLPHARVVAEWTGLDVDAAANTFAARRIHWLEGRTDTRGMFRICGVPVNTALVLRADGDGQSSVGVNVRIPADRFFANVSLTADPAVDRGAVFTGVVLDDSTRRPIANVEIALPELSRSMLTNDQGRFRIGDIPPGSHQVVARRIGYGLLDTRIAFAANRTVERRIILSPITTLESVIVTAERTLLPDFEENRRRGLGHFVTRAELARQEGRKVSGVLAQVPGTSIVDGIGNRGWVSTSRGLRTLMNVPTLDAGDVASGAEGGRCYAQVYLDRMLVYAGKSDEPLFDVNSISPDQIEAMEWYAGPSQTPLRYSGLNSACGVLVIHTRRSP